MLAAAVLVLVAGYVTLAAGHAERRGGAAGDRVLRAVPGRDRAVRRVRRHGTVPAQGVIPVLWASQVTGSTSPGRIAQLVQSACLTRRMSGVRIPLRPFASAPSRAVVAGPPGPILCGGFGMFLFRLVTLAVVGSAVLSPLAAQGIPRGARPRPPPSTRRRDSWWPIPFAFAAADSAPAVKIGTGLREEMKGMVGRDYQVVEQAQMNDALKQYGYPDRCHPEPGAGHHARQEHPGPVRRQLDDEQGRGRPVRGHRASGRRERRCRQRGHPHPERQRDAGGVRQAAGRGAGAGGQVARRREGLHRPAHRQARQGGRGGQQGHQGAARTTVSPSTAWRCWRRTRRRRARRS